MKQVWTWGAALIAAGVLAACGGGGDSNGYGAVAVSASTNKVAITSEHLTQSIANGVLVIAAGAGNTAFDAQTAANNACTAKGGTGCGVIPNLEAQCN
jgi:hypothetical protein